MKKLLILLTLKILSACQQSEQKRDGQAIYYQSCVSCHEQGHGGAPKRGDNEEWMRRLDKGKDVLLENLKKGYNTMPAKGACFSCSDQELALVLDYLLNNDASNH